MSRVFLSHSSKDKSYVEYIANKFGKDTAFYDKYSFECGMRTFSAVLESLNNSDLFVIFLSNNALESEWVKKELNIAYDLIQKEKIKQCYPIIIDPQLSYKDERIPKWLKTGFESYNLRYIGSPQLAYRKIKNRLALVNADSFNSNYKTYIGQEEAIKRFDDNYYMSNESYIGIIACGIEGIGRESFIRQCIKVPLTFGDYYEPIVINIERNDSIDDVISKLFDNGFGEYNDNIIEYVNGLKFDEKISELTRCLMQVQNSREFIIFRDADVLIQNGKIVQWLNQATKGLRPELTFGIVSNQRVHKVTKNEYYVGEIAELNDTNKLKLLDKLSKDNGVDLDRSDVQFFKNILTGHPLQIIYCIQRIQSESMAEVRKKSHEITEFISKSTSRILDKYLSILSLNEEQKDKFLSYLSFISSYSNIPIAEIIEINKLDPDYQNYYGFLIKFCMCRRTGLNNDLLTTSHSVADYIERMRIEMPDNIKAFLKKEFDEFKNDLKAGHLDAYCYSQISKNLGELVKENPYIKSYRYIYPSIILKSIVRLYNDQGYDKVINICEQCIANVEIWDQSIKQTFYFYYAMALARKKDDKIFEIIRTKNETGYILEKFQADFIRGFYYKLLGQFKQAEEQFVSCLDEKSSYDRARRELVETYIALEEYDEAIELSRINYNRFPDNIFNIFQYFKCLIRQKPDDIDMVKELLNKAQEIDKLPTTSKEFYPCMKAYYNLYRLHDYNAALRIMLENENIFSNKIYYYRDLFDIYTEMGNIDEMEKTLHKLKDLIDKDNSFVPLLLRRECIFNYYINHDFNRAINIVNRAMVDETVKNKIKKALVVFADKH
ncbi:MAG: TIR domain-containing protein [Clostridia bacterium]|nr:TIR domain-containing protein [Clostridia bacterium]